MTNHDSGAQLLQDAELYYEEMQRMFEKERWNIVVRRAQEVVELSLKGILKIMGMDKNSPVPNSVNSPAPLFKKK
jgi:HEPN domain-containing protein